MKTRLKTLRLQHELSQQQLADIIGCSSATYSRYETASREPSIDVLIKLSDYYGISLDYLVGRDRAINESLSDYEIALVEASRKTSPSVRDDILDFLMMKAEK